MKRLLTIFMLLAGIATVTAATIRVEKHVDEVEDGYNYWLAHPADTVGAKPVVIFLHGASLCGIQMERVKRYGPIHAVELGREVDAYIIAPQNPGGAWRPAKVKRVLDSVKAGYDIDTTRIYVVGMSLGGYGTIDFAAAYPDEVAAAVAICGGGTVKDLSVLHKVPLWLIHGTADRAVSVRESDRIADAIKQADSTASRLIYDRVTGMNHSQPARVFYLPEMYEWLFLHNLAEEERPLHETVHIDNALLQRAYRVLVWH